MQPVEKVIVVGPDLVQWSQYVISFTGLVALGVFESFVIWNFVWKPRAVGQRIGGFAWTLVATLCMSVAAIPFSLPESFAPFVRYSVACYSFVLAWHGGESLFGTLLDESSCRPTFFEFSLHTTFAVPLVYDGKHPLRTTWPRWRQMVRTYGGLIALKLATIVILFSLLGTTGLWESLRRVAPFAQHYLVVVVVFLFLSTTSDSISFFLSLIGFEPVVTWNYPFLGTSRRDIWSRWNQMIGRLFHRTVFGHCRRKWVGALLSFALSGAFHEYVYLASYLSDGAPYFGYAMAWFLQEAVFTIIETFAKKSFLWLSRTPWIIAVLWQYFIALFLPVNFLFIQPFIRHDLLIECASLFPRLARCPGRYC